MPWIALIGGGDDGSWGEDGRMRAGVGVGGGEGVQGGRLRPTVGRGLGGGEGVGEWGGGGGWKEHVLEENSFAGLEDDQTGSLLGSEVFWSGDAKIEEVFASCLSTPRFRAGKANRTSR